jgi:hypothetical protein
MFLPWSRRFWGRGSGAGAGGGGQRRLLHKLGPRETRSLLGLLREEQVKGQMWSQARLMHGELERVGEAGRGEDWSGGVFAVWLSHYPRPDCHQCFAARPDGSPVWVCCHPALSGLCLPIAVVPLPGRPLVPARNLTILAHPWSPHQAASLSLQVHCPRPTPSAGISELFEGGACR